MLRSFHSRPESERMTGDVATSSAYQTDGTLDRLKAAIRTGVAELDQPLKDVTAETWGVNGGSPGKRSFVHLPGDRLDPATSRH